VGPRLADASSILAPAFRSLPVSGSASESYLPAPLRDTSLGSGAIGSAAISGDSFGERLAAGVSYGIQHTMSNVATRQDLRDAVRVVTVRFAVAMFFVLVVVAVMIAAFL
jgi:hypothetical protein